MGGPNRSPPVEHQFKPGQIANPGGRPKLPEDIKEIRKVSQFEFERLVNHYLSLNGEETKADLERPEATNLERMIGGVIERAVRRKDAKVVEWILSRTLGKMRERLEIESKSVKVNIQAQGSLPSLEQLAMENPELTPSELSSFSDKLTKLREEISATQKFRNKTLAIDAVATEVSEGEQEGEA